MIISALGLGGATLGCAYECNAGGCPSELQVALNPPVLGSYDVRLVLDGEEASFSCVSEEASGQWRAASMVGVRVYFCDGAGFDILDGPDASLEISVEAQDGTFSGSTSGAPSYETFNRDGDPRCGSCRTADLTVSIE